VETVASLHEDGTERHFRSRTSRISGVARLTCQGKFLGRARRSQPTSKGQ
jgi:hypothetical protein